MPKHTAEAEKRRLAESADKVADWKLWGTYLSDRAWGTVREDYSADGSAWEYFPFEQSHLRAYRWNEDGIAGICDRKQNIVFAPAFWNGRDPILKERLFGVSGPRGNHGEDVKECYYHLDNTPTHSYAKLLYKYPHAEFPYKDLYDENARRTKQDLEYELADTGIFNEDRFFDITVEYAKSGVDDICIRITATNRGPDTATLHVLPTVWFRNVWTWYENVQKPTLKAPSGRPVISIEHPIAGRYELVCEDSPEPELLFCENESNSQKLFGSPNLAKYTKDGIGNFVVGGDADAVNPERTGTKAAADYVFALAAGESRARLSAAFQAFAVGRGARDRPDQRRVFGDI